MTKFRALVATYVLVAAGLARVACGAAPGDSGVAPADRDKVLGPGDVVTLEILEDKTPPISKRITDTGDLDVPYIGRVHVAGKSCSEVVAQVTRLLEADYYYKATVKLGIDQINTTKQGNAGKIYVSGDAKASGPQEIPPGENLTASEAVVKAGGGTQFADLRKVKVTRKEKDGATKTYTIDVKAVLEEGHMDKDMQLIDGDHVFVPRRLITF